MAFQTPPPPDFVWALEVRRCSLVYTGRWGAEVHGRNDALGFFFFFMLKEPSPDSGILPEG